MSVVKGSGKTKAGRQRRPRPTPKGAAARGLKRAKASLHDLERTSDPNQKEGFANRFNDFLGAARTVPEFLEKEPRGSPRRVYTPEHRGVLFMKIWMEKELLKLSSEDRERYDYLLRLREISNHDLTVEPDRGDISLEIRDVRTERGGETVGGLAHAYDFGSPGAENVVQSSRVSTKYFFREWPQEDIVTLCKEVVRILDTLVNTAYQLHP